MRIKFLRMFVITLIPFIFHSCSKESSTTAAAVSFTADMITVIGNERREGKIYVKGNEYRTDVNENGEDLSIVVDRESGKHKVIVHSEKSAREAWNNRTVSLANNPFEAYNYSLKRYSSKEKGSETINGYECKKVEIFTKDRKLMTAWVAKKFNWPIKIITSLGPPRNVELRNIKEEPVEEELFEVPEDYEFSPLPETKKEQTGDKEKQKRLLDVKESKEAVYKKLEEKGTEMENEDGKIAVRSIFSSGLAKFFPGWHLFYITREDDLGGNSFSYSPIKKAAVEKDNKDVYFLYEPETDTRLENGLKISQRQNIELKNKEEVEEFGKVLFTLYFKGSRNMFPESLGDNRWAIYISPDHSNGFIVELNDNGEIVDLNYKLKIKDK